jgi:hypothetical protein
VKLNTQSLWDGESTCKMKTETSCKLSISSSPCALLGAERFLADYLKGEGFFFA